MEEKQTAPNQILDDGQYMDPLYYIAYSTPTKLQKVVYDFGGKPANSKEELYAMSVALRAAPSGGKKFMNAVYAYAHPDIEEILLTIKEKKPCNCSGCINKETSSYAGCGCGSSNYSYTPPTQSQAIESAVPTNSAINEWFKRHSHEAPESEPQPKKQNDSWFSKLPNWAKITGIIGITSILTAGMMKLAKTA